MEKIFKIFKVKFIKVNPEDFDVRCGFCEKEKSSWWCEWLGEGYCAKCMKEQVEEYESVEKVK